MDILGLKKTNCKNCHRCIRECPVKSIEYSKHQAKIIKDGCILCGRCLVTCPQNAKIVRDDVHKIKNAIAEGRKVIASVAPSFIVDFPVTGMEQMKEMLLQLGFSDAEETAIGASIVKSEYEKILLEKRQDVVITTCCPSVISLIQKYFPHLTHHLAPVISPMDAHAQYIKEKNPHAYVAFIGPCISKKSEIEEYKTGTDCVITFEELRNWMNQVEIKEPLEDCLPTEKKSRFFPKKGGIIQSMNRVHTEYHYHAIDGAESCIATLKDLEKGLLHHCFIEMSMCAESCINGPMVKNAHQSMLSSITKVVEYAVPDLYKGKKGLDFNPVHHLNLYKNIKPTAYIEKIPTPKQLQEILSKTGKFLPAQELNCGSCGYPTCREKAIAVFNNKAEIAMCLPYMTERAESLSDKIINSTPNAILVLDEHLTIQQINQAATILLNIKETQDISSLNIGDLMDPTDLVFVLEDGRGITDKKMEITHVNKFVEETIVYDRENKLLIVLLKDITIEEQKNIKARALKQQTVDVTDKIIEKQMRIVQEIASLLGETTAETKIALSQLKKAVESD